MSVEIVLYDRQLNNCSSIDRIRDGCSEKIAVFIDVLVNIIAGVAVAMYFSWQIALLSMAFVPLLVFFTSGWGIVSVSKHICMQLDVQFVSKHLVAEMASYAKAASVAEGVISGIRTVLAFNAQPFELKRYEKPLDEGRRSGIYKAM